jgi:Na+/H+-dicarboxylate symporter
MGMYAVVVAIEWFLDRFRMAVKLAVRPFATVVFTKVTGTKEEEGVVYEKAASVNSKVSAGGMRRRCKSGR